MVDVVETLLEAADLDDATFRDLVRRHGEPDRLSNLVFDEGMRVQTLDTDRMLLCIRVIDRLDVLCQR
jgi:hypothetical protein